MARTPHANTTATVSKSAPGAKATGAAGMALRSTGLRDTLDRDLLALLQVNARASTAELARQLGTARTTVLARLERLEREGVIAGYTVRLGQDLLDQGLQAFVGVTVQPKAGRDVVRQLTRMPEVRQLCAVSVSINAFEKPSTSRPYFFAPLRIKYSDSTGISSFRSRSGGMLSVKPFRR